MFDFFAHHSHITPAGPADDRVRLDALRMGEPVMPINWEQRPIAESPGAYNYAFTPLGLYEEYPAGNGYGVKAMPIPFQTPIFAYAGVVDVGLGGLIAGDILSQPLYDPNTSTYGGYPI